jgi:hypothetical protein
MGPRDAAQYDVEVREKPSVLSFRPHNNRYQAGLKSVAENSVFKAVAANRLMKYLILIA